MGVAVSTTNKYQKCIDACARCAQACCECFKACLNEPDVQARTKCIAHLAECSRMCEMAMSMMSADSMHAKEFCTLCATMCEECAAECAKFHDEHCTKCADVCRACAQECRAMAGA